MGLKKKSEYVGERTGKKLIKKRVGMALIGAVVLITLSAFGFNALFNGLGNVTNDDQGNADIETTQTLDDVADLSETVESEKDSGFDVTLNWGDEKVQDTIHKMSHQKVIADQKWGSIMVTQERIETLSQVIEGKKDDLENYDLYRDILDRWMKGDFSQADDDHNAVWELQGGSIGYATGITSKEQENTFTENTFDRE